MDARESRLLRQHLIDPEICIRCNTCEETCPNGAITHDSRNYVVDPAVCKACLACIPPCPTGAIDNWRTVLRAEAWTAQDQLGWDGLPEDQGAVAIAASAGPAPEDAPPEPAALVTGATLPPLSAAQPCVNLYTPRNPATATVMGNYRLTEAGSDSDIHHVVLDFGAAPFPLLEGQSIGIVPPGTDAHGRPHHARQFSVASPRDGERPGYNNLALTVRRVTVDHEGRPTYGVCSNYICDLRKGDNVQVIGPFGTSFLMPEDVRANLLMICTGTGSAPMRAMTERRRRRRGDGANGRLVLFFGARAPGELPYFGPLLRLPPDFIEIHFAFSRVPGEPRRYVQDAIREQADAVGRLLADPLTYVYVCGVRGMEAGVLEALGAAAAARGLDWESLQGRLRDERRLHLETW
ncbi:MAG: benzoyl-CoA 2,3-epoxidase subunit BoxA [Gammaproteobacteria bacterium]|nr:benzoyl-CoA 2,3-epoxidase subunit BoxA [Gammaproteobacteria bacterium]